MLTDWTMYLNKEAYFIKWFSYWLGGFSFGNIAGMALARFYGKELPDLSGSSGNG
jgi:alpha/beta superfamily hydrolase